jgi:hypothetical protein
MHLSRCILPPKQISCFTWSMCRMKGHTAARTFTLASVFLGCQQKVLQHSWTGAVLKQCPECVSSRKLFQYGPTLVKQFPAKSQSVFRSMLFSQSDRCSFRSIRRAHSGPLSMNSRAGALSNCINHAYTTEGEEIMGLLLGDVHQDADGNRVTNIWRAIPQIRNDRCKVLFMYMIDAR